MIFSDLRSEQARQIVDVEQIFSAFAAARTELAQRFSGSMFWRDIKGGTYLYRKTGTTNQSLGPKSPATELAYTAFNDGRATLRTRVETLTARLDEMAPVNRALGLGRLPLTTARILRHLGASKLIGNAIDIVGTNALFAYERMAGLRIESGLLATGDIDLLYDARRTLKLFNALEPAGLLAVLQRADRSFSAAKGSFRATNNHGFMVDLLTPAPKNRMKITRRTSLGDTDDLQAIEIEGLNWLANSPKLRAIVIDERGYPVEMFVPDPRAFALHKAWLSQRDDRELIKRNRDMGQARLVAQIATERLGLSFASDDLTALPKAMREGADHILPPSQTKAPTIEPDW